MKVTKLLSLAAKSMDMRSPTTVMLHSATGKRPGAPPRRPGVGCISTRGACPWATPRASSPAITRRTCACQLNSTPHGAVQVSLAAWALITRLTSTAMLRFPTGKMLGALRRSCGAGPTNTKEEKTFTDVMTTRRIIGRTLRRIGAASTVPVHARSVDCPKPRRQSSLEGDRLWFKAQSDSKGGCQSFHETLLNIHAQSRW
mmetsp:Transcript_48931/g.114254  ORF Transcript_48931/g.114254 Transcript_48931/m.114254 type:complete len:201 (+) Transcript_48931:832-1434(+)